MKVLPLLFIILWHCGPSGVRSAIISGGSVSNREIFSSENQEDYASSVHAYDIVTPVKVSATGEFVSHDLRHSHGAAHDSSYKSWKGRSSGNGSRRRRDIGENKIDEDNDGAKVHYALHIDGELHTVQLEPNSLFLAPHAVIERRAKFNESCHEDSTKIGGMSSRAINVGTLGHCHYVGRVLNHKVTNVALSTCDGLKGFLHTDKGEFLIEPQKGLKRRHDEPHPHIIYRRPSPSQHTHAEHGNCDAKNYEKAMQDRELWEEKRKEKLAESEIKDGNGNTINKRAKRSVSVERNVEVLVVADKKMIDFYSNEDLNTYILTIMNMVSSIYHDASIGNAVNIIVVRIMLLETPQYEEELDISHHADDTLFSFCQWQQMVNPSSENHPHHHDVAVLLTRYNICSRSNTHCSTLGVAEIAGMCQPHRSCNVNEDTGLQIAYTIAHEIGHNFGMNHDSPVNGCGSLYGVGQHVMSPHLATDSIPITWSNCSRNEITTFLDRDWGTCLVDEPQDVEYNFPELPPGAMYDADHQCRLAFGANVQHCSGIDMECQTLWCRVENRCVTRLEPAAEGTQCGHHKWCSYGKCVTMGERPAAIHGSWGQWSGWSTCSRSCGAGVAVATRQCDNPAPSNGGKYCTGNRRRYRICNTQDCEDNGISFRGVQCSAFDGEPYKGKNHTWGPVTVEGNPCQLHCKPDNEFYSIELKDTVADGTPCNPGTRDMCIHGICKRVSCDWTIEGTAQEDRCGLCHGDGTQCVTTSGIFNMTSNISYVTIVTFPAGARKVKVEEMGDAANYLAVKNEASDRFYLNGNWIIQWTGEYSAAGVMMYYKRENETESLFLPGPLKKPLTLMLLFQTENPGIKWEYTVAHENATYTPEFHWHSSDWSVCTRTCGGGTQMSKAQCMEKESGLVEDKWCDEHRPEDKIRECNTHSCPAWWWSGPWQPCSVTCGSHGNRRRTVICVRSYGPTEQMALLDSDCTMSQKPHEEEVCPELSPCLTDLSWSVGPWIEACKGDPCEFERREVSCQESRKPCDPLTKPPNLRQCGNITCGHWVAGEWGECSTTCGEGVHIRSVECVGGSACAQREEPGSVKECNLPDCPLHPDPVHVSMTQETMIETESSHINSTQSSNDEGNANNVTVNIPRKPLRDEGDSNGSLAISVETGRDGPSNETSFEKSSTDILKPSKGELHPVEEEREEGNVTENEFEKDVVDDVGDDGMTGVALDVGDMSHVEDNVVDVDDKITKLDEKQSPIHVNKSNGSVNNEKIYVNDTVNTTGEEIKLTNDKNKDGVIIEKNIGDITKVNKTDKETNKETIDNDHNKNSSKTQEEDSSIPTENASIETFENESFKDYEAAPDEYYESEIEDVQDINLIENKKNAVNLDEENQVEAGEEDLRENKEEIKNVTTETVEKELEMNANDVHDKIDVNNEEDKDVPRLNDKLNDDKSVNEPKNKDIRTPSVNAETENETTKDHETLNAETDVTGDDLSTPNETTMQIDHTSIDDDDEYYYDDDDYNYDDYYDDKYNDSTELVGTSNETVIQRPEGIVEDKLDLDEIQVIEIKMRKNKKSKKYRHKKSRKNKIKKVKIHTGEDALKLLKKIKKKANAKPSPPKDNDLQPTEVEFEGRPYSPIHKWTIGPWSQCSDPCGGGSQRRAVECQNSSSGDVVPPWECHALPPADLQHCNMFRCLNWTVTPFGSCSSTCGPGTRTRNATCPKEGKCHNKDLPALHEECMEDPCVQWVEGPWSMCTKSCDSGYQIRFVKCVDVRTQEASQECQKERPLHKRSCNVNKCQKRQGQQNFCKDSLDTKLCRRLVHMCSTKFFRVKCCRTCHRRRG